MIFSRSALRRAVPTVLSVRRLAHADPALIVAYGGDPERHTALGLVTCDQDDALYVAKETGRNRVIRYDGEKPPELLVEDSGAGMPPTVSVAVTPPGSR